MVKNRKLSRAISDLGWRSFRDMLSAKSDKYGRNFRIISRWEPTSQRCSCCGNIGGKKALNVRDWECLLSFVFQFWEHLTFVTPKSGFYVKLF
ncbi:MAG: transposase [Microcystis aeruginosa W13-15]|nr:transposase [Microcystis aeruginosa W13-16]NCQ75178.1 transposase [Microcystis aeruginosa W13-13]NCQ79604.1 transposase [Microcystis aeruginosa W13-15]NCS53610.1 transposase [Microcystis aeruginosa G13-05]